MSTVVETLDERAERLRRLALDLAEQIRTEDPLTVKAAVEALTPEERTDLVVILAAHVPLDIPESTLIGWWRFPESGPLKPCGTLAAAKRHKARSEPLCGPCETTLREYERVRARQRRARVDALTDRRLH